VRIINGEIQGKSPSLERELWGAYELWCEKKLECEEIVVFCKAMKLGLWCVTKRIYVCM